jgi:hypothetical protein
MVVRDQAIQAEKVQREREIDRVNNDLALTRDPSILSAATFMDKLRQQTVGHTLRALYFENRAFEYWSLQDSPLEVLDDSAPALAGLQADLESRQLTAMQARNRPPQRFLDAKVVLTAQQYPEKFKAFTAAVTGGKIDFVIRTDHDAFRGMAAIAVDTVKITVTGARTDDNKLYCYLVHNGRAQFVSPDKQLHDYTHLARPTLYVYDLSTGQPAVEASNDIGGQDSVYAYLSPFAAWTLVLPPQNKNLRLDHVSQITLDFSGQFLPFSPG